MYFTVEGSGSTWETLYKHGEHWDFKLSPVKEVLQMRHSINDYYKFYHVKSVKGKETHTEALSSGIVGVMHKNLTLILLWSWEWGPTAGYWGGGRI